jgi:hypothetical protein
VSDSLKTGSPGEEPPPAIRQLSGLLAVTSVPPTRSNQSTEAAANRRSRLAQSLASFSTSGFQVVSVNHAAEIPKLQASYGDLAFLTAAKDGLFTNRYGPSLGSVFDACRQARLCAVINADVYLVSSGIAAVLERNPGKFYVARRADIVDYGKPYVGTYTRGIDAFFFWPEHCSTVMNDPEIARLQLGAPMWDIAVPVIASFHSDLAFIQPPFLLHPIHKATWSRPDYDWLRVFCSNAILKHARAVADTSVAARRFLHVVDESLGRRPSISRRRDAKLFMRLANFWLQRIEMRHSVTVEVNRNDPVLSAALRGQDIDFAELANRESVPEAAAPRWPPLFGAARAALRRWKRARRAKGWNRLFDEAEQRFAAP